MRAKRRGWILALAVVLLGLAAASSWAVGNVIYVAKGGGQYRTVQAAVTAAAAKATAANPYTVIVYPGVDDVYTGILPPYVSVVRSSARGQVWSKQGPYPHFDGELEQERWRIKYPSAVAIKFDDLPAWISSTSYYIPGTSYTTAQYFARNGIPLNLPIITSLTLYNNAMALTRAQTNWVVQNTGGCIIEHAHSLAGPSSLEALEADYATAINLIETASDYGYVKHGLYATFSGLDVSITSGAAVVLNSAGVACPVNVAAYTKEVTPSKDTYFYLNTAGEWSTIAVSNWAAAPAVVTHTCPVLRVNAGATVSEMDHYRGLYGWNVRGRQWHGWSDVTGFDYVIDSVGEISDATGTMWRRYFQYSNSALANTNAYCTGAPALQPPMSHFIQLHAPTINNTTTAEAVAAYLENLSQPGVRLGITFEVLSGDRMPDSNGLTRLKELVDGIVRPEYGGCSGFGGFERVTALRTGDTYGGLRYSTSTTGYTCYPSIDTGGNPGNCIKWTSTNDTWNRGNMFGGGNLMPGRSYCWSFDLKATDTTGRVSPEVTNPHDSYTYAKPYGADEIICTTNWTRYYVSFYVPTWWSYGFKMYLKFKYVAGVDYYTDNWDLDCL